MKSCAILSCTVFYSVVFFLSFYPLHSLLIFVDLSLVLNVGDRMKFYTILHDHSDIPCGTIESLISIFYFFLFEDFFLE